MYDWDNDFWIRCENTNFLCKRLDGENIKGLFSVLVINLSKGSCQLKWKQNWTGNVKWNVKYSLKMKAISKPWGLCDDGCSHFKALTYISTSWKALTLMCKFWSTACCSNVSTGAWQWCKGWGGRSTLSWRGCFSWSNPSEFPARSDSAFWSSSGFGWIISAQFICRLLFSVVLDAAFDPPVCVDNCPLWWNWYLGAGYYYLTLSFNIQGRHFRVRFSS